MRANVNTSPCLYVRWDLVSANLSFLRERIRLVTDSLPETSLTDAGTLPRTPPKGGYAPGELRIPLETRFRPLRKEI